MNLENQTKTGTSEIHINDSLALPLLKFKMTVDQTTIIPNTNELIVYIDKAQESTPTDEQRKYVFNLSKPLTSNEEFSIQVEFKNDAQMIAVVTRSNETKEIVDVLPIILFEGENYIYTNYTNEIIEVIYPKNDEINQTYLSTALYALHRLKNRSDFSLDDIYFKDAFTKTEDKLNIDVDNANIRCLTSKNNKFSLDEEGNLVVNTITANNSSGIAGGSLNLLDVYPIGSIYMSTSETDPSTLFGGKWTQLEDRFLLGAGSTYINGTTGGEATHLLTDKESGLREHYHIVGRDNDAGYGGNNGSIHANGNHTNSTVGANWQLYTSTVNAQNAEIAHNNMPPYLVVYMWQRIS